MSTTTKTWPSEMMRPVKPLTVRARVSRILTALLVVMGGVLLAGLYFLVQGDLFSQLLMVTDVLQLVQQTTAGGK